MKAIALGLALMLSARSVMADTGPCDASDAPCITRKALEYKYKADALQTENDLLRQENQSCKDNSQNGNFYFLGGLVTGVTFVILTLFAVK